jgi:hypothetical protein
MEKGTMVATEQELTKLAGEDLHGVSEIPTKLWLMIFGDQGAGKTFLAATASLVPELCPVLFLDIEGGVTTVQSNFPTAPIKVIRPRELIGPDGKVKRTKWEHIEEIYEHAKLLYAKGTFPYKTTIFDSLSEGYQLCQDWWLHEQSLRDPGRDLDVPGYKEDKKGDYRKEGYSVDYDKIRGTVRRCLRGFRDLDTHFICTAHADQRERPGSDLKITVPAFSGKSANQLPGFMNEVYYLGLKMEGLKTARSLQCQATTTRPHCKSRGNMPAVLDNPDIGKIVELCKIPL